MELSAGGSHGGQPLGEILVERGLISPAQLDEALAVQRDDGRPLGEVIIRLGFASGHTIAQALATQHGRIVKSEYGFATGFDAKLSRAQDAEAVESASRPLDEGLRVARHADADVVSTLVARIDAPRPAEPSAAEKTDGSDGQARVLRLTTQLLTATGELTRAESARAEALAAAAEHAAARRVLEESAAAQAREIEQLRRLPQQHELEGALVRLEEDLARSRKDLAHATDAHKRELEDLKQTFAARIAGYDARSDPARAAPSDAPDRSNPANDPDATTSPDARPASLHFLFFPTAGGGYTLVEGEGAPPQVGEIIDVSDDGGSRAAVVAKLGRSPLPGAPIACAFLI